jgi:hypothetical protein
MSKHVIISLHNADTDDKIQTFLLYVFLHSVAKVAFFKTNDSRHDICHITQKGDVLL